MAFRGFRRCLGVERRLEAVQAGLEKADDVLARGQQA